MKKEEYSFISIIVSNSFNLSTEAADQSKSLLERRNRTVNEMHQSKAFLNGGSYKAHEHTCKSDRSILIYVIMQGVYR